MHGQDLGVFICTLELKSPAQKGWELLLQVVGSSQMSSHKEGEGGRA